MDGWMDGWMDRRTDGWMDGTWGSPESTASPFCGYAQHTPFSDLQSYAQNAQNATKAE